MSKDPTAFRSTKGETSTVDMGRPVLKILQLTQLVTHCVKITAFDCFINISTKHRSKSQPT
jgi:hypothetical protein